MLLLVSQVYFEPEEVYACIVTCGGLCPGLNTVIREIVCGLYHMYGVHKVLGIEVSKCISHYNQTHSSRAPFGFWKVQGKKKYKRKMKGE
jgi:predicted Co/Zn/Cd cation transporter (cation efflux family)